MHKIAQKRGVFDLSLSASLCVKSFCRESELSIVCVCVDGHNRTWEDIAWIASITDMPVVLKGISSPEDAVIAAEMSVEGARNI